MTHLSQNQFANFIGFNRMIEQLLAASLPAVPAYPPMNIIKEGNRSLISMAIAGFDESELNINVEKNTLIVKGAKQAKIGESEIQFIHRGLAFRDFNIEFLLGEGTEVVKANLDNGILEIYLETKIPEGVVKSIPISNKEGISNFLNSTKVSNLDENTSTLNTTQQPA